MPYTHAAIQKDQYTLVFQYSAVHASKAIVNTNSSTNVNKNGYCIRLRLASRRPIITIPNPSRIRAPSNPSVSPIGAAAVATGGEECVGASEMRSIICPRSRTAPSISPMIARKPIKRTPTAKAANPIVFSSANERSAGGLSEFGSIAVSRDCLVVTISSSASAPGTSRYSHSRSTQ